MDLLVFLYEFQNPRLTAEILSAMRSICLRNVRMTSLKCFVLSSVLSCTPTRYNPGHSWATSALWTWVRFKDPETNTARSIIGLRSIIKAC